MANGNLTPEQIEAMKKSVDLKDAEIKALEKLDKLNAKAQQDLATLISERREINDAIRDATAAQNELNASSAAFEGRAESMIDALTGLNANWKNQSKAILFSKEGFEGLGGAITKLAGPMTIAGNLATTMAETSIELAMATENASVAFNKQTGMARKYASEIASVEVVTRGLYMSVGDLYDVYGDLSIGLQTFGRLSEDQRSTVAQNVALLDKMGVSSDVSAENIKHMNAAMGMTVVEASEALHGMYAFAQQNDIATAQMMQDFEGSQATLAKFGSAGVDVFLDLALAAEKSNMAVGDLIRITEQFDAFDTAAEAVGRLNAVLGGAYLNAIEMTMTTNPVERMHMLKEALDATGRSFDSMAYYERKAIADAAGLKDVSELALVMGGNFELVNQELNLTQEQIEANAQQAKDFTTIMDQLRYVMMQLAIGLGPVVDFLKTMIDAYVSLDPAVKGIIKFAVLATAIGMAIFSIVAALGPLLAAAGAAAGALGISTGGLAAIAAAIGVTGAAVAMFTGTAAPTAGTGATGSINRSAAANTAAGRTVNVNVPAQTMGDVVLQVNNRELGRLQAENRARAAGRPLSVTGG